MSQVIELPKLLTLRQISEKYDCTISWLQDCTGDRLFKFHKPGGRKIWVEEEEFVRFLMSNPVMSKKNIQSEAKAVRMKSLGG